MLFILVITVTQRLCLHRICDSLNSVIYCQAFVSHIAQPHLNSYNPLVWWKLIIRESVFLLCMYSIRNSTQVKLFILIYSQHYPYNHHWVHEVWIWKTNKKTTKPEGGFNIVVEKCTAGHHWQLSEHHSLHHTLFIVHCCNKLPFFTYWSRFSVLSRVIPKKHPSSACATVLF